MAAPYNDVPTGGKLETLLRLLDQDPANASLLSDAADAALAERRPDIARDLIARCEALAPLSPAQMGQAGLSAMQLQDFTAAAGIFAGLREQDPADASLRFNLAWSLAMLKRFDEALALLNEPTLAELPQAAMLQVQLMHDGERHDEAFVEAKRHLERHPSHKGLAAAVSVLAMDMEDMTLARDCAMRGGDHPDALTTLGVLALGDEQGGQARALFERALKLNDKTPRAWVGIGLAALAAGDSSTAARDIEHGAEMFADHVGSWIAAGWAHVLKGDLDAGRRCFEKALSLDHNFSESHGSLGVVAILENRFDDARQLAATALRLDRKSFSGALAQALLLQSQGKPDAARKIIDRALNTPVDASGKTIAQAMARQALFSR